MAACLVKGNRWISVGINRMKSDPFQAKYAKNKEAIYLHAEIHCIKNALKEIDVDEFRNSTLYITRVKRADESNKLQWGLAKPCPGCQRAITEFGIKNVVYTTNATGKYEILCN